MCNKENTKPNTDNVLECIFYGSIGAYVGFVGLVTYKLFIASPVEKLLN